MTRFHISFTSYRDTAGYSLVGPDRERYPVEQFKRQSAQRLFAENRWTGKSLDYYEQLVSRRRKIDFRHIVGRGGKLEAYQPLEDFEGLYLIFARTVTSTEGALDFTTKFGHLFGTIGPDGKARHKPFGEAVFMVLDQASRMRKVLATSRLGETLNVGTMNVKLSTNPATSKFRLGFVPSCLHDALWLQLGEAQHEGFAIRECLQCGIPFRAGRGAGRRLDAKFCSREHQIAFNSLKRTRGG